MTLREHSSLRRTPCFVANTLLAANILPCSERTALRRTSCLAVNACLVANIQARGERPVLWRTACFVADALSCDIHRMVVADGCAKVIDLCLDLDLSAVHRDDPGPRDLSGRIAARLNKRAKEASIGFIFWAHAAPRSVHCLQGAQ
jgi:hypothetical protein